MLIGALQIAFGLLKLGSLTRSISYSVMTGFIMGIAVLTTLSQLPTITGYQPEEGAAAPNKENEDDGSDGG